MSVNHDEPPTASIPTFFGIPIEVLKTGGTVLILLAILAYVFQISNSKDQAYVQLATSNQALTIQIQSLSGKVDELNGVVTNMRIQFARAGLDTAVQTPPTPPLIMPGTR